MAHTNLCVLVRVIAIDLRELGIGIWDSLIMIHKGAFHILCSLIMNPSLFHVPSAL